MQFTLDHTFMFTLLAGCCCYTALSNGVSAVLQDAPRPSAADRFAKEEEKTRRAMFNAGVNVVVLGAASSATPQLQDAPRPSAADRFAKEEEEIRRAMFTAGVNASEMDVLFTRIAKLIGD